MPAPDPYVYEMPLVEIDGTDFVCYAEGAELMPSDRMADGETFCTPGLEIPTSTTWALTIDFKQSYGTDGLWNLLNAMAKTKKTITLRPNTAAVAVGNPQAVFSVYIPTPKFMAAKVGETMAWTMEATVVGEPVFTTA